MYSYDKNTDSDSDGLSDYHEYYKYHSDPNNPDTDGDGYIDGIEAINNYSPLHVNKKFDQVDSDSDGLNDLLELRFKSDIKVADTDGDGYNDKQEIDNGYDPTNPERVKLEKKIIIDIDDQRLRYYLSGVEMGEFMVSTGRNDSTPRGEFTIGTKHPRAWSNSASLWMPYWMPFYKHLYGIHELPEWPNGVKEGLDSLGQPVSGGCVRVGQGDAQFLYEWTPQGTKVIIE